jgi:flagellar hook-associated protein 2
MAGIRISGMASGLPPNIVEQIMEAERIPLQTIEKAKAKDDDKLKLVTDLETKITDITKNLGELTGTKGFTNMKLTSGDPSIVDGTVDPQTAVTGQWQVEVMQLAQKPGAVSNGFPDADKTELGTGYLRVNSPEGRKDIYIDGGNSSLNAVAAKINSSNTGLRATVINDRANKETPFRLMITGLATGDDNQVEFPTVYMLDGDQDFFFESSKKAQNAKVKVDGFEFEVPDNMIKDIIPGITLDIKQAALGREVRVGVKEDLEVISGKIKGFVDAYNASLSFIQGQSKLQKGPDGKERLGPLGGDGMTRQIESRLRSIIQNPVRGTGSEITRLNELGIEFTRQGTLNFTAEKFNNSLQKNPIAVAQFLRGDGFATGFVPTVKREIGNMTNSAFGALGNRKRGIQQRIDSSNKRIETKERQLEKREDSLRKQFSDLESKMSKLQQQMSAVGGLAPPKS